MKFFLKFLRVSLIGLFTAFTLGVIVTAGAYLYIAPKLPSIEVLKDIQLQTPLRVHAHDGALIAEFGEKKRTPLKYSNVPDLMIKAVLAAEDDRFWVHPGVDYQGILRATVHLLKTGKKGQGGSTITMQVARNFFLSREKTYLRKVSEIFLALKIEQALTKQDILELYLNKIYLGRRAYGFAAASQVYYGKNLQDLRVDQIAMIAGLPKAPSRYNPVANSRRATIRRNYVLGRMHELNFIDTATFEKSLEITDDARQHRLKLELQAAYVAEMVRAELVQRYGKEEATTSGFRVTTTLDTRLQRYANQALNKTLLEYDRRHGYRGAEAHIDLDPALLARLPATEAPLINRPKDSPIPKVIIDDLDDELTAPLREVLNDMPITGGLAPAIVLHLEEKAVTVMSGNGMLQRIEWQGLKWARRYISENRRGPKLKYAADVLKQGDIIRISKKQDGSLRLVQIPNVEGALVTLRPEDGAVRALVGGFDFYQSKFNRVTQAYRQPGSNFKPFIYSAALENGFTAASIINDAPVVFDDPGLENTWRPENYSGKFFGPTRLRVGLTKSRNLISIRLLRAMGIKTAINYVKDFGFDETRLPRNLSLALGSASLTPLELVSGYAVLANGGYRVMPHFIEKIEDSHGNVIYQANPAIVCKECEKQELTKVSIDTATTPIIDAANDVNTEPAINTAPRVMEEKNNFIVRSILKDVIRLGTGRKALSMGRRDIAGKTGTTNDQKDAWFSGFSSQLVTTAWVGFDKHKPLGSRETGASAALPMWIAFMSKALKGVSEQQQQMPQGLVTVKIDPETGFLAAQGQADAIFETFRPAFVPRETAQKKNNLNNPENTDTAVEPDQIF